LDNGSTDVTVEKVRQLFPEVHLILSQENLGPTGGWNMGIREVLRAKKNYKYIWLLDSDAEVESQTLISLVEAAENDAMIAVVGSAVYEPDKRDQLITAGLFINWNKPALSYHRPSVDEPDGLFNVEIVPGCSMITRTDLFRKFGMLDERLWLYWGDAEWSIRALRNGYRVCCLGKSRAWHRNWANIKPGFNFPYALHGRVCSELLFHFLYNPKHSILVVRNLILKNYLKAAFENLTLRPNFTRAYDEGVQDFLKGYFYKKNSYSWSNYSKLSGINEICQTLSKKLSRNPRIILNQIPDESQKAEIRKSFSLFFHNIRWEEIKVRKNFDSVDASDRLHDYIFFYFPKFLLCLLTFFKKRDVIISSVAVPCLYNITSAKYTILIDQSLCAFVQENRIAYGFKNLFKTIIKGLRVVFIDFPRITKNAHDLYRTKK
jgi:GT2 family glycosyltransferase